ncbi:DMT family transporter [Bordetella holmesii]|uniref:EamA-like transporter family protein n=2 Tax=Bordetella holmesii TaxID=35814 RepID=A0A158M291_9BORD|nr:DMT family transporter [Bordetella holmesii]AHV92660.1 eamA-like transporter family protein [Bordetella holmesii ATCC 51541]AIT25972.1 eamA-like transporter family protein [Bordetella holmesii 44057]EWM41409.1 eamA-like transporter family protein [Bordetella holmesii 41130]EWM46545.1 eamA-like transporter family protein [Bordetella holmesii 35009]EWM50708.1 eamA-like transporter family protein [Bordetella holmesii 70147]
MQRRELLELIALAAVWGGSFLFMRVAVPEFGPAPLIELRVGLGALVLLPLAILRGRLGIMARHWKAIFGVGLFNAALPFLLYAYASISLGAGFLSVANAVTPVWGAVIGWLWLRDRLPAMRILGLAIGFVGNLVLVWDKLQFQEGGSGPAVLAALAAPLFYGVAANWTKRFLSGVDALANATGSMLSASLVLLPLAIAHWPEQAVSSQAWIATVLLAVLCTGAAYVVFFRLILVLGPTAAVSVTFLVPVFGVFWGVTLLGEALTPSMLTGAAIILAGTALALGLVAPRKR